MTRDALRAREYLGHIVEAIRRIRCYTEGMTEAAFARDERTQDAVMRNIGIVGEASRNVARHHPEFAARHGDIPWEIAYEMRNALSHGYFKVDLKIVWNTIKGDLPKLEQQVQHLHQA
ncbi:MAG: DUF86 domain-containing protein [Candidatus Accumulibacter sp.]|jgi:uncharacterized protein with HEPN domain|uniref:DUF86 domain-containing protein n=1 Tax=Candidatus Accumulibacter affinis TaxID=2954384 RepID=A0A935W2U7_9PROT|nr:DUF86 domain-containing protein [Candidatus Accumulibacter affinis]